MNGSLTGVVLDVRRHDLFPVSRAARWRVATRLGQLYVIRATWWAYIALLVVIVSYWIVNKLYKSIFETGH